MSRSDTRLSQARVVRDWLHWPQGIAPSAWYWMRDPLKVQAQKRFRKLDRMSYIMRIVNCAKLLIVQLKDRGPTMDEIVVFYPQKYHHLVTDNLRKKHRTAIAARGLSICSTPHLRTRCMAFRIADVEQHKTPADPYFVQITASAGRRIRPAPIYTAEESGIGEVIE